MSFKDIRGQDRPIAMLKSYIEEGRLEGGYLFTGPEGVGKKLAAKTLAQAVNCLEDNLDACDKCTSCIKIEKNQHPDVHMIDASTPVTVGLEGDSDTGNSDAIKISHVRQLQKDISLRAYEAKKKVFIIDNAHNLTAAASNALLKILEEPPEGTLIILITDKPGRLFKTIVSRCRILKFPALKRPRVQEILHQDYHLDTNIAHFLAYFSEGRLGRALKLKDTDILREKNRIIDTFALARRLDLENIPAQKREDVRAYLNILAAWFRDIYLMKIGMPHQELVNSDRKEELLKIMNRFSYSDLNTILDTISDSVLYLERNINIKLLLHNLGAHLWKE